MLRDLRNATYAPTLAVRPGEMRGLEELSERDKDNMVPVILLAPWVGSHTLDKAIERIDQAYGNRAYFLDLDTYYANGETEHSAQIEFRELLSGQDRVDKWKRLIESHSNIMPVLFHSRLERGSIANQVEWAERLGRGYGFRFADPSVGLSQEVLSLIQEIGHSEFGCFLDGGWSADPLFHELWFRSASASILGRNENVPVVTSTSNFPKDFSDIDGLARRRIGARQVFDSVRTSNNAATFVYGDWASTKPRIYERSGAPLPRIDYATRAEWIIARSKSKGWSFFDAAKAIRESPFWNSGISTWGSYMIERTAMSDEFAINTTPKAVAARVNLHLHMQTNFSVGDGSIISDDPWVD